MRDVEAGVIEEDDNGDVGVELFKFGKVPFVEIALQDKAIVKMDIEIYVPSG